MSVPALKETFMKFSLKKYVEFLIFSSKWLLIPFYLVLIAALAVYTYFDVREFIHYIINLGHIDKEAAMLTFIELIDMTMIANLGKQLVTGSYHSFISKRHGQENENASSGMLKVKMGASLVGITSIALLQKSVEISIASWDDLKKLAFVHLTFLASVIILSIVDYLHEKSESFGGHEVAEVPEPVKEVTANHIPISTTADHKHH
jgi:uncharacterized protein (TIGR00645 family)